MQDQSQEHQVQTIFLSRILATSLQSQLVSGDQSSADQSESQEYQVHLTSPVAQEQQLQFQVQGVPVSSANYSVSSANMQGPAPYLCHTFLMATPPFAKRQLLPLTSSQTSQNLGGGGTHHTHPNLVELQTLYQIGAMDVELLSCLSTLEAFFPTAESHVSTEDSNLCEGLSRRCDEFIQLLWVLE